MKFTHERIDENPPCSKLASLQTADLTGNGLPDVIVTGTGGKPDVTFAGRNVKIPMPGPTGRLLLRLETNVFWYENPGWERHTLASESRLHLGVGSTLCDVDKDGKTDLVVGQGFGRSKVLWYEQPQDPRKPWQQHLITDKFEKYHDLLAADIDGDGNPELIGLSQDSETTFYYDIPDNPFKEPWPDSHLHILDESRRTEGLAVADIDGDGAPDLIAGTNAYFRKDNDWIQRDICTGWDDTRVAVADIDSDGKPEVVLSEGDSPVYGTHPARVAWVDYPNGEVHVLRDDMFCPHSLQTADITGNGHPDIYTGEMSLGQNDDPEHIVFENLGGGEFQEHVIERGIPTHEARLVDMTGNGSLDIVGKSYGPDHHVDIWYRE